MTLSVQWKLNLGFASMVALLLTGFIAADYHSLRTNLEKAGLAPAELEAILHHELWEHALLAVGMLVVMCVVGFLVIGAAFRPLRGIVDLARSITAEDLSLRIDRPEARDEFGELIDTLNDMIARLEQSFDHVRQFSGDVAHELNTPLTILKGEVEVALRRERTPQEHRQVLSGLLGQIDRLSTLVDDLLFLARTDERRQPTSREPVPLNQMVLEVYEEFLPLARDRGLTMEVDLGDGATVSGDPLLLRRMLGNLVDNAVKFTPEGGRIDLEVRPTAKGPELSVTDTGIGIPAGEVPRVFERFHRVDRSRSQDTGGVGLGLAIVDRIATLHGCKVTIQSRDTAGIRVTVRWSD